MLSRAIAGLFLKFFLNKLRPLYNLGPGHLPLQPEGNDPPDPEPVLLDQLQQGHVLLLTPGLTLTPRKTVPPAVNL